MRAVRPYRRPSAGLSVLELLIVVAVMGILAGLVLPKSDPSLHEQLRATAQIIAADLAYGRSLAVTNNSWYRFTFDTDNNQYVLDHSGSDPSLDALPDSPFRSADDPSDRQIVDLDDLPHLGSSARIVEVATAGVVPQTLDALEFGPLGETRPAQQMAIWLAAGEGSATRYIRLEINPVTGLTTIGPFSGTGPP